MTKKRGNEHFRLLDEEDVAILEIAEDLGSLAEDALHQELKPILARVTTHVPPRVVVDFQQCDYFGSALLEEILRIGHVVQEKQGSMALCNLSATGRDLINVVHFERLWPVFVSRQEAIAHVRRTAVPQDDQ